jgi:predicted small lipoprotein YifL
MLRRLPLCVSMALIVSGMLVIPGCGVRGSLETPPRAKADTTVDATPGTPGAKDPNRPSILDPLLR